MKQVSTNQAIKQSSLCMYIFQSSILIYVFQIEETGMLRRGGSFVLEGDRNLEEHATPYQTKMQAYAETGFSKYVWGRIGITQVSSLC